MNVNPLRANPTKWSNTLKQFVGKLPTNCLSVFDHFVGLVLKGLIMMMMVETTNKSKINIRSLILVKSNVKRHHINFGTKELTDNFCRNKGYTIVRI